MRNDVLPKILAKNFAKNYINKIGGGTIAYRGLDYKKEMKRQLSVI